MPSKADAIGEGLAAINPWTNAANRTVIKVRQNRAITNGPPYGDMGAALNIRTQIAAGNAMAANNNTLPADVLAIAATETAPVTKEMHQWAVDAAGGQGPAIIPAGIAVHHQNGPYDHIRHEHEIKEVNPFLLLAQAYGRDWPAKLRAMEDAPLLPNSHPLSQPYADMKGVRGQLERPVYEISEPSTAMTGGSYAVAPYNLYYLLTNWNELGRRSQTPEVLQALRNHEGAHAIFVPSYGQKDQQFVPWAVNEDDEANKVIADLTAAWGGMPMDQEARIRQGIKHLRYMSQNGELMANMPVFLRQYHALTGKFPKTKDDAIQLFDEAADKGMFIQKNDNPSLGPMGIWGKDPIGVHGGMKGQSLDMYNAFQQMLRRHWPEIKKQGRDEEMAKAAVPLGSTNIEKRFQHHG